MYGIQMYKYKKKKKKKDLIQILFSYFLHDNKKTVLSLVQFNGSDLVDMDEYDDLNSLHVYPLPSPLNFLQKQNK